MGCEKAWKLMMSRLDGGIGRRESMILENHLRICPECRRQSASLQAALLELEQLKPAAPGTIEQKVMGRIRGARRKETAALLPYNVLPAKLLTGILAFLLYKFCMAGPMIMIDKAARALTFFYKVYESMDAVSSILFNTPYLSEILVITGFALLAGVIVFVFMGLRKKGNSEVYWRAVK